MGRGSAVLLMIGTPCKDTSGTDQIQCLSQTSKGKMKKKKKKKKNIDGSTRIGALGVSVILGPNHLDHWPLDWSKLDFTGVILGPVTCWTKLIQVLWVTK